LVELQRLRLLPFLGKSEPLYRIVQGMSSCIENLLTHREVYCQDKFTLLKGQPGLTAGILSGYFHVS
ncbi:MAG: hypothetical protein ACXW52_25090, partial [Candidatus Binatia bacterium]